ncbi:MAG: pyridoxal-phosphate dependent enzyme [Pseudobdellovibrionaceae bacterium]
MIPVQVLEIQDSRLERRGLRIFTTAEGHNPGGSIKDHLVMGDLSEQMAQGNLVAGSLVSEVSAGSTALSLAYYCQQFGFRCHLFLPNQAPSDLQEKLRILGATLHLCEVQNIYSQHEEFHRRSQSFAFNQLGDASKSRHYVSFGQQILQQAGNFDVILGAVGTGLSLKGTALGLGVTRIFSAEPEPGFKVSGIRNVESERYGAQDACLIGDFEKRWIVRQSECFATETVGTANGTLRIGPSFQVVLAAVQKMLVDQEEVKILALGAKNLNR